MLPVKTPGNIGEVALRVLEISRGTPSVVPTKNFPRKGQVIYRVVILLLTKEQWFMYTTAKDAR